MTTYQRWKLNDIPARIQGRLSVQRCAYTQITEGGVIPAPPVETNVTFDRHGSIGIWTIENPALPAAVCLIANFGGAPYELETVGATRLNLPLIGDDVILCFTTGMNALEAQSHAISFYPPTADHIEAALREIQNSWLRHYAAYSGPDDPLWWRGMFYSLSMAIPVGEGVCFLTDHMLLPLSWNRDAYYLACALLSWRQAKEQTRHRAPPPDLDVRDRQARRWRVGTQLPRQRHDQRPVVSTGSAGVPAARTGRICAGNG
ncbi:MAG: hypothetical protein IPK17_33740 [Chloroflexi bacterium]|uniref:hypothetical protein n=1 Tax=Candidatus Flexifilum breve TaxID=3140694 RepID=UPI0031365616|nr:hypothetical protein [Chloroflexota bacterium]